MKKVMMLTTTAYMSERFNRNNIMILEEMGYEVHVVANFDKGNPTTKEVLDEFKGWIEEHHGKWISIPVTKSPADIANNYPAYKQLLALIKEHQYEFIHCHTPVGGVLGRFVAHRTHTKVIYTAHGFHFFDGAPMLNWILYYPVERFLSGWTDMLITINQEDYNRAKKSFHAKRTEYIPGVGIDTEKFQAMAVNKAEKRKRLGFFVDDIILLSVGELNENKNHQVFIRAIAQIKNKDIHYVIVGQGKLSEELKRLAHECQVEEQVHVLGYRNDVAEIYQIADVFIFPSKREGLSVALMEAMACGLPVICSDIRGNHDLIIDGKGGILVNASSVEQFAKGVNNLCIKEDRKKVINTMSAYNLKKILDYDSQKISQYMKKIYEHINEGI